MISNNTPADIEARKLRLDLATQRKIAPEALNIAHADLLALLAVFTNKDGDVEMAGKRIREVLFADGVPVLPVERIGDFISAIAAVKGVRDAPVPILLGGAHSLDVVTAAAALNDRGVALPPPDPHPHLNLPRLSEEWEWRRNRAKHEKKLNRKASRPNWRR